LHERIETWILLFLRKGGETRRELAFNLVWRNYHKRIRFFIRNRVRDEAEDLTQEVMLKVYQNLDRFDPGRPFNAWIYSIARNHCINHLSKKRPDVRASAWDASDRTAHPDPETPESNYLDRERERVIDSTLADLDADLRETAFLKFREGLSGREIADITGVPEGTVKSRLHFIRMQLEKALEEYNAEGADDAD
jgi:RNA polymerase sigma-70 factor, ECF subfamily